MAQKEIEPPIQFDGESKNGYVGWVSFFLSLHSAMWREDVLCLFMLFADRNTLHSGLPMILLAFESC